MSVVPFEDSKNLGSLLDVNQLDYRLAPSLSVAVSRSMKSYPAHRDSYTTNAQDHVIFTATSGGQYVDLLNSYIKFTVQAAHDFEIPPQQSMLNLFKGIRLIHSSGEEIDRVNGVLALWNKIRLGSTACADRTKSQYSLFEYNDSDGVVLYNDGNPAAPADLVFQNRLALGLHTQDKYDSVKGDAGRVITFNFDGNSRYDNVNQFVKVGDWVAYLGLDGVRTPQQVNKIIDGTSFVTNDMDLGVYTQAATVGTPFSVGRSASIVASPKKTVDVVIPLACLHDFFNKMRLCPVFLISGMRIELDLEASTLVFPCSNPAQNYTITNATLDLESIAITDGIARRLAQISGSRGLVWNWTTVFTQTSYPSALDHSVQITKAVSRANQAIFFVRNTEQFSQPYEDALDSSTNAFRENDWASYQFALGAEFMPIRPMTTAKEFHHASLKCWEQFRRVDELAQGETYSEVSRMATACTSLENSTTLAQAGVAINSQRTAVASLRFVNDAAKTFPPLASFQNKRRVDLFLTAEKIAVVMLDSISIRS